jgi:signal transduction histidine kinase
VHLTGFSIDFSCVSCQQVQKTVLRNLITNAIKFTPPRGKIEVFAEKKGNMVELAVTDSGIGIEAAVPSKLS